jgi:hypothetical protein
MMHDVERALGSHLDAFRDHRLNLLLIKEQKDQRQREMPSSKPVAIMTCRPVILVLSSLVLLSRSTSAPLCL